MYNINILKKQIGYFNRKKGLLSMKAARSKVLNKLAEIERVLGLEEGTMYYLDSNGVPFVGKSPSALYLADEKKLKHILPVNVPTTFFVTGDAFDTNGIGKVDKIFKKYENIGLPRSHKIAQSLICKALIDNPVYIKNAPLIPIGIDNYIFASPEDVVKRFKVIQVYKLALEKKIPNSQLHKIKEASSYAFGNEEKKRLKVNLNLLGEFVRIFPNRLKTVLTNEPPSAATCLTKQFSSNETTAIVQMNYGIHPSFLELSGNYYLYFNPAFKISDDEYMKRAKKCFLVSILPIVDEMLDIDEPPNTKTRRILLSSGGAAGRIFRMIDELSQVKVDFPLEILALTGVAKRSKQFNRILKFCMRRSTKKVLLVPIPNIDIHELEELYSKSHASIGLPGTYTALSGIASGRPFGAIIDSRKSKDKVFVDHFRSNALFIKDVLNYPTVIIKDRIRSEDIKKLFDVDFVAKAYVKVKAVGGIRDRFLRAKLKWRDVFIYFLK